MRVGRTFLAVLGLLIVDVSVPLAVPTDSLAKLQDRFDRETDSIHKAKLLDKLGDAEFEEARKAEKANDYSTVGLTLEKYRDNVRAALGALKKEHPEAERHSNGYRQLEIELRKGLREVNETLLLAPAQYQPPLQLVRQDLSAADDELLRMLFPRRPGEKSLTPPAAGKKP
jgi:hypothetical protein